MNSTRLHGALLTVRPLAWSTWLSPVPYPPCGHSHPWSVLQDAHKIFLREIVVNLAIALAGVFLITTLMLGSLVPSLIVTTLLIVIDIEVLGSIYLSGDYFNTVTGINLVLAVGLSVDAVAHITHCFLAHDGTGDERAAQAVVEIGRSVFNGAMSTMIVLIPLAAAQTYIFQVFFRTFMAIIGYSAFNGLVVLPVILSVVRPTSFNTIRNKLGMAEQDRSGAARSDDNTQAKLKGEPMVIMSTTSL
jgi:multidrug efflux pump subunit AcrB